MTQPTVYQRAAELLEARAHEVALRISDRCYRLPSYRDERMPREESRGTTEGLIEFLVGQLRMGEDFDPQQAQETPLHQELMRFEEGIAAKRVRFHIDIEDMLVGVHFLREEVWALFRRELHEGLEAEQVYGLEDRLNSMVDQMFVGLASSYVKSQADVIRHQEKALEKWEEVVKSASEIRLKIPCREEFVGIVRLQAEAIARRVHYNEEEIYDILTAVGEVCDNSIEHGKSEAGIEIQYLLTTDALRIEVVDFGPGFDPTGMGLEPPDVFSEGGRGIFLMKNLMDEVDIDSRPGRTRVVMSKRRHFRDW